MKRILLILLCGLVEWSSGHMVYPKEVTRATRHGVEEWRPVVEKYTNVMRYPVREIHPKGHYNKKVHVRQSADHSEKVEVFSPAPPSILGSFSVFGHATVNAREHASHITKKSPRPLSTLIEHRPEAAAFLAYPIRHQILAEPQKLLNQRFPSFEEQSYFFDASLRPPPPDHVANPAVNVLAHSASLAPNAYYFEPPHAFRTSADLDLTGGYHKIRKPPHKPHAPFRHSNAPNGLLYQTSGNVDQFKLSTRAPPHYETINYYDTKQKLTPQIPSIVQGHYDRNPFGDARYTTRRPDTDTKKMTDDRTSGKDVFRQLSHLGRPFQSSPPFSPTPVVYTEKEFQSFKPYVTTYASSPVGKLSGQPFRAPSDYDDGPIVSAKPDFFPTQQPYTQDFSVTATTLVESPTEQARGTEQTYTENTYASKTRLPSPVKQTDSGFKPSFRLPQVHIASNHGYNNNEDTPFLPTPSTDTEAYINEPVKIEEPTPSPALFNEISKKSEPSARPEYEKATEYITEPVTVTTTTTEVAETTTRRKMPSKNRRRPVRPTEASLSTTENPDDVPRTRKVTTDYSSTTDYQKNQRRRKPQTQYVNRGGSYGSKNRHSEFKRFRSSTTTTTPEPEVHEATRYPINEYSTVTDSEQQVATSQFTGPDVEPVQSKEDYYQSTEVVHYSDKFPNNDVRLYENEQSGNYFEESPTETAPPPTTSFATTTTTRPPTTETTTASTTTAGGRFRNKYGNGNRPRFSVKDYRERLNRITSTTTTTPTPTTDETDISKIDPKESSPRHSTKIRGSAQYKNGTEGTEQKTRKYKPRVGASRYKTSTAPPTTEPTAERSETQRPSTGRYKPGTGKYYSRYRTSTASAQEPEQRPASTTRPPVVRPKGVFSAKRRPFPLKTKFDKNESDSTDADQTRQSSHRVTRPPTLAQSSKTVENEVFPAITKKMDDVATTTMISAENFSLYSDAEAHSDPTGAEAMRIADLTSSSSNEFESSGFLKGVSPSSRRTIPKITISTDDPILPLEAFFQTQNKDKKK